MLNPQSDHSCDQAELGHKLVLVSFSFQIWVSWSCDQNENGVLPTTLALLTISVL